MGWGSRQNEPWREVCPQNLGRLRLRKQGSRRCHPSQLWSDVRGRTPRHQRQDPQDCRGLPSLRHLLQTRGDRRPVQGLWKLQAGLLLWTVRFLFFFFFSSPLFFSFLLMMMLRSKVIAKSRTGVRLTSISAPSCKERTPAVPAATDSTLIFFHFTTKKKKKASGKELFAWFKGLLCHHGCYNKLLVDKNTDVIRHWWWIVFFSPQKKPLNVDRFSSSLSGWTRWKKRKFQSEWDHNGIEEDENEEEEEEEEVGEEQPRMKGCLRASSAVILLSGLGSNRRSRRS